MLQELRTKEDVELFAEYKVDLIKLHQEYAKNLGLFDNKVNALILCNEIIPYFSYTDKVQVDFPHSPIPVTNIYLSAGDNFNRFSRVLLINLNTCSNMHLKCKMVITYIYNIFYWIDCI